MAAFHLKERFDISLVNMLNRRLSKCQISLFAKYKAKAKNKLT